MKTRTVITMIILSVGLFLMTSCTKQDLATADEQQTGHKEVGDPPPQEDDEQEIGG